MLVGLQLEQALGGHLVDARRFGPESAADLAGVVVQAEEAGKGAGGGAAVQRMVVVEQRRADADGGVHGADMVVVLAEERTEGGGGIVGLLVEDFVGHVVGRRIAFGFEAGELTIELRLKDADEGGRGRCGRELCGVPDGGVASDECDGPKRREGSGQFLKQHGLAIIDFPGTRVYLKGLSAEFGGFCRDKGWIKWFWA